MRVGVIGTGWGLMHVGAFRAAGADVVALGGVDRDKTAAVAARERVPIATDVVAELVAACDLVVVASPDALHRAHVEAALSAGRAVVCEKPLATTLADARAMLDAAAASSAPLAAVCFPYRFLPPFVALRAWLAAHLARGARVRIAMTMRTGFGWDARSGDLGGTSHVIDAVRWLVGAGVTAVHARARAGLTTFELDFASPSGGEACAVITWLHAPEPGLFGSWSLVAGDAEAGFSAGYVPAAGGWCIGPIRVREQGVWRDLHPALVPRPHALEPWAAACHAFARDVLAALDGDSQARTRAPTFADGVAVQEVIARAT